MSIKESIKGAVAKHDDDFISYLKLAIDLAAARWNANREKAKASIERDRAELASFRDDIDAELAALPGGNGGT